MLLLNSEFVRNYDLIILQETNVCKDKHEHAKYDDFSSIGMLGTNIFYTNQEQHHRGTIIAWNPDKINVKVVKCHEALGFEIAVLDIMTRTETFTIVAAYRSPSMSVTDKIPHSFFDALADVIATRKHPVIAVGDWNVERGRTRAHNIDEAEFLKCVERSGVKSKIKGNTHTFTYNNVEKQNQLDYVYSNIEQLKVQIVPGVANSDHKGFDIKLQITCQIIMVPTKYVNADRSNKCKKYDSEVLAAANKIIEANVPTGDALLELEISMYELRQDLINFRRIKSHRRVMNTSRQISKILLDNNLDNESKRSEVKKMYLKDAARKLLQGACDKSPGVRIMAPLAMAPKSKQLLKCEVDPEKFKDAIIAEEKLTDHTTHPQLPPTQSYLLKPIIGDSFIQRVYLSQF